MPRTKGSKNKPKDIALTVEEYNGRITAVETSIEDLNAQLKLKKAELKQLIKDRDAAVAVEAEKKAEEDRAAIIAAIEASGKSVDEVLAFLKG